ncbi:AraC family transcriptional regulator [Paenibacillus thermoaerophilus]|nr:AraC family transcriptional regulator [Paenibacillus thermoaerophilus]
MFRLRSVEGVKGALDWSSKQQFTDSHVLMAVLKGEGSITLGLREYRLQHDTVYVCPPHETYGISAESPHELMMYAISFDVFRAPEFGRQPPQTAEELHPFPLNGPLQVHPADQLPVLCGTMLEDWQSGDELDRFHGQLVFQQLIHYVMKNSFSLSGDPGSALQSAKDYMDRFYNSKVTIHQLAQIAKISPKYFVDLFKKTYGVSAMDYLTSLRINQAKRLMARSGVHPLKMKDIAQEVGYHDEFYFSRRFKKEVGMTPTVYIKSRRRKIAAYTAPVAGQLLALHIIPYAAPMHPKWTAYYYKTYREDIAVHLSAYRKNQHWEANVAKLAEARPDIVICTDRVDQAEKEKLDRVAPVVYVPWELNWRDQLRFIAEALGETREAELWLESYDRKITMARDRLRREATEDTVLILRISNQTLSAYCNRSMAEVFYGDLRMPASCLGGGAEYDQRITPEQLADVQADRLLLLIRQETETLNFWSSLQHSAAWLDLKAVRNHRVCYISSDPWCEYSASAHERIVITGSLEAMEDALALGVKPVGGITVGGKFPGMFAEITGSTQPIGEKAQPDIEAILKLKPDVILSTTKFPAEVGDKLVKIAPTIPVSHVSTDWEANLRLLAELTGNEAKAEQILQKYKADLENAKKQLGEKLKDKKVVIVRIRAGNIMIYHDDIFFNPSLYADLGLTVPEQVKAAKSQEVISLEKFSEMNPDYIFVQFSEDENADKPKALEDLQNNPIWKSLNAVKNNRVFVNVVDPLAQGGTAWSKVQFLKAAIENLNK